MFTRRRKHNGSDPQKYSRLPVVQGPRPVEDPEFVEGLQFLAELAVHVPARREQTVRYMGKYSARSRGATRLALDRPGPLPETDPPGKPSANWARCMALVFELDPLTCPKCGGAMNIKTFIHDSKEITRIAENLGLQPWRAPPPMPDFKHAA